MMSSPPFVVKGFQRAFDLFDRSITAGLSSCCNRFILFMTDGYDGSGQNGTAYYRSILVRESGSMQSQKGRKGESAAWGAAEG